MNKTGKTMVDQLWWNFRWQYNMLDWEAYCHFATFDRDKNGSNPLKIKSKIGVKEWIMMDFHWETH